MSCIDLAKTFCIAEAINSAAERAFDHPHNSKFLTLPIPIAQCPRSTREGTPSFSYQERKTMAFSFDDEMFFDPHRGLTFGSDDETCDVLLDINNERGLSTRHFRLTFARKTPDPQCVVLWNMSANGTLVNNDLLSTGTASSQMLDPNGSTFVQAGPVRLRFEIPRNRDVVTEAAFRAEWEKFRLRVRDCEPKLEPLTLGNRFGPTPPFPVAPYVNRETSTRNCLGIDNTLPSSRLKPRLRCDACRTQGLKCDRGRPCNHCKESNSDCTYPFRARCNECTKSHSKCDRDMPCERCRTLKKDCGYDPFLTARGPRIRTVATQMVPSRLPPRRILPNVPTLTDNYVDLGCVGQGVSGVVHKVASKTNGKILALKIVKTRTSNISRGEIDTMSSLQHPYIVACFDSQEGVDQHLVLMEYVPGGTLGALVEARGGVLDEGTAKTLGLQMLGALSYVHQRQIIHRDIKPDNILVRCKDPVHFLLSDFGFSRSLTCPDPTGLTFCGTLDYCAPEVYPPSVTGKQEMLGDEKDADRSKYDFGADIWSLAATIWHTLSGKPPFKARACRSIGEAQIHMYRSISKGSLKTDRLEARNICASGIGLLVRMLQVEVSSRPTAEQCLAIINQWTIQSVDHHTEHTHTDLPRIASLQAHGTVSTRERVLELQAHDNRNSNARSRQQSALHSSTTPCSQTRDGHPNAEVDADEVNHGFQSNLSHASFVDLPGCEGQDLNHNLPDTHSHADLVSVFTERSESDVLYRATAPLSLQAISKLSTTRHEPSFFRADKYVDLPSLEAVLESE